MNRWLRRLRGALGMGFTWAIGWAVVGGTIMEGFVDRNGEILDMWPQTLAVPGFLLGVVFSMVLWASERRRRFDELSIGRTTALGALGGAILGAILLAAGIFPAVPFVLRVAMVVGPLTALSAASAAGSLAMARFGEDRSLLRTGTGDEPQLPTAEEPMRLPREN